MDISFTGQADYTLDAKNRLTVPARYRDHFAKGLVLAKDIEPCIAVWPTKGYAAFCEEALASSNPMSASARKVRAFLAANSYNVELDGAGRAPVQPFLTEHAAVERDGTVVGVGDHLHIGVEQEFRKVFSAPVADSDPAERDPFARRDGSVFAEHPARNPLWNRGRRTGNRDLFQKATSRTPW